MKTSRKIILGLIFVLAAALLVYTLSRPGTSTSTRTNAAPSDPQTMAVEYFVYGTARSVNLTYTNASGGIEQKASTSLPFRLEFEAVAGQVLSVSVQNDTDTGDVNCAIKINGVDQKTATSSGAYVIATCSGRFTF